MRAANETLTAHCRHRNEALTAGAQSGPGQTTDPHVCHEEDLASAWNPARPQRRDRVHRVLLASACSSGASATPSTGGGTPAAATPTPPAAGSIAISGAGASFPFPLYSRWFYEYAFIDPKNVEPATRILFAAHCLEPFGDR